jgi:hypothetical protein
MSTPRDRDGFDDRGPGDWQEPEHLGGTDDAPTGPPATDRPADRPAEPAGSTVWQPPGWDLPTVEPERPRNEPSSTELARTELARTEPATTEPATTESAASWDAPAAEQRRDDTPPPVGTEPAQQPGRGLFGSRRRREPGAAEQVFRRESDTFGVQAWALHHGWVTSDGSGPQDAPLAELVRTAPVRPGKEDRAGNVLRGRGLGLDLVAFDIVSPFGRDLLSRWAVTAAPLLGEVPAFRLSPARFWKHRTAGLLQVPSGDAEFDTRWVLLTAVDGPQVRRLVEDPVVRQLLLGTDDGDELWSAGGFVAAVRPDGQRPQLIEHHARLLSAVVGALAAAA